MDGTVVAKNILVEPVEVRSDIWVAKVSHPTMDSMQLKPCTLQNIRIYSNTMQHHEYTCMIAYGNIWYVQYAHFRVLDFRWHCRGRSITSGLRGAPLKKIQAVKASLGDA